MTDPGNLASQSRAKRSLYDQTSFARDYDRHFHLSPKGKFVFEEEKAILREVIPAGSGEPVLDIPAGTGRFLPFLREMGYEPVAADISYRMLARHAATDAGRVCADAARLPFSSASFGGVLSHRFLYHYSSIDAYLAEFRRVVRPGGWVCFDVIKWTPSSIGRLLRIESARFVHVHSEKRLRESINRAEFVVGARRDAFLVNPGWAPYLCFFLVRALLRKDGLTFFPRVKSYFLLRKKPGGSLSCG